MYYLIGVAISAFDKKTWNDEFTILLLQMLLPAVIGVVMLCFNGWNWYLAFSGHTAIDFWQTKAKKKTKQSENA